MVKEVFNFVRDIFKDSFSAIGDFFKGVFYDEKN